MGKRRWYVIGLVVLALLWLQAELRSWQLNREIRRVYVGDVIIKAIDADTQQPLPIVFQSPTSSSKDRWPKSVRMSSPNDGLGMHIRWVGVAPVEVGVSSNGYAKQIIQLDAHTDREIVVSLRRSGDQEQGK